LTVLALAFVIPAARPAGAQAQEIPKAQDLIVIDAAPLHLERGASGTASVTLHVRSGWHVNSNPAASPNSIPTSLAASGDSVIFFGAPQYPPGRIVKLPIDDQPLSLWDGTQTIRVPVTAAAGAAPGAHLYSAKLRFQACNDQLCLPPTSVEFRLPIEIAAASAAPGTSAGASAEGAAGTTPATAPGGTTEPRTSTSASTQVPSKAAAIQSPLAGVLLAGGWLAFLTLFLIGLGLNLTPCVYPMLSVTVSIFGARRASSPAQAVGSAVLYVLGMASMYSVLGVMAALTGSLFGGWLSNPIVTIGIGVLLVAMSLSMFGLYQLSLPPALLARLGGSGATSALQIFASGLMVGLIAAPCVGPPVVALLAVVAQKADPLFGFSAFFTLAMGLGAPYLVLATFSNLLQKLPRSGEWMIWVEKVFGLVLFGVGLNYILLALAPAAASWVLPGALIVGGVWLGFAYRGKARIGFRLFQRGLGLVAVVAGALMFVMLPRPRLAFEPLAAADLAAPGALTAPATGQLTLIDFSADWCQPCHELDNLTFTDRRVMKALADFKRLRVDLTHYDSPEAELWRKRFEITGVPTLVFALGDGHEVREARVEGFLPPDQLLDRIDQVRAASAAGATSGNSTPP
jgi:thiol:disulfide interchange protein DsbD